MTVMSENLPTGAVLVAVDGSPGSDGAVAWAAQEAALRGRPLVITSAADAGLLPSHNPYAISALPPEVERDFLAEARATGEAAAKAATAAHPDLEVSVLPAVGDPREILIELSREAELIVMGSRGRGTVASMLLGSVSASVARHSACPVVVCRPSVPGASAGVVVAADGSPESRPVIEFAFAQASRRGLPLTVVHCFWDAVVAVAGDEALDPQLDDLRATLAESVAGMAELYPDVDVTRRLVHGLVDEAILREDAGWDLVVVGRHPWNSLTRWLTGSVATTVLEHAHSTVAVVPEPRRVD